MTCHRCSRDLDEGSVYCRFCGASVGARPASSTGRRLTRIPGEGRLAGVCAGLAAYFDADVTLVRLTFIVLSVVPGVFLGGIVAYIAAWILIPAVEAGSQPAFSGRRLVRSTSDRMMGGVCGGLADYFGVDATIVRVVAVVLAIYPGAIVLGVLAYLIAWFIIPPPTYPPQPASAEASS
jgi:phage shock protein C